jgi:hypothetical protein
LSDIALTEPNQSRGVAVDLYAQSGFGAPSPVDP